MSYYYGGFAPYVTVAERRRKAEKAAKALQKQGAILSPVTIAGSKIAKTFWGKAWCDNLESYRDFAHRLERGRSYARNGLVLDLQIAPREVTALVSGSELYKVKITVANVAKTLWQQLCSDCSGGIDSLVELLQGRFSKPVMARICQQQTGLFPAPKEIRFTCSCPDHASMCKHVAAALYGVGTRLDDSPELLFKLRAVEAAELLSDPGKAMRTAKAAPTLADTDLAALFDLDMAEDDVAAPAARSQTTRKAAAAPALASTKPKVKTSTKPTGRTQPGKAAGKPKSEFAARLTASKPKTVTPKPASAPTKLVKDPAPARPAKYQTAKSSVKTQTKKTLKNQGQ